MQCNECLRQETRILKSIVAADKAETDLRCYLLAHLDQAGVSDLDEYKSLKEQAQRTADLRHTVYMESVDHRKKHAA